VQLTRNPRTACRVMAGRAVVVSIDANRLFILNSTATRIWEALAEPRSLDDLARDLGAAFKVDEDAARSDCNRFCDDLRTKGLVIAVP
jgi:hypothetical protein